MKNIDIKSFKNGTGLITELLFLIMIICICFTHITFAIITAIIIFIIRDFENYILYKVLENNDIEYFNFKQD